jgi:broad specificity phosphatase PhoE
VRHADSAATFDPANEAAAGGARPAGSDAHIALTARGCAQARQTGAYLAAQVPFDACFAPGWRRALQTLDLLLEAYPAEQRARMRAECREDERLRPQEHGIISLLSRSEVAARYPDEARRRALEGDYYYRPLGGESWADVTLRAYSIVNTIFRDRAGQRVLIVAPSVVILSFRKLLERLDAEHLLEVARRDPPRTCSISRFVWDPDAGQGGRLTLVEWSRVVYADEYSSVRPSPVPVSSQLEEGDFVLSNEQP